MKFSRDGLKLAVARYSGQIEILMWTVSNGKCQWSTQINLPFDSGTRLAFSADDSKIACKSDKTIVLDAESGEECNSEDTFDFESTYDHVHEAEDVS